MKTLKRIISIYRRLFNPKRGLYKYKNYKEYKDTQIKGNKNKIDEVWVSKKNIRFLAKYIKKNIPSPEFGICHGTRRGKEQEWFMKYLPMEVIGTEISPTATEFPNTIQWDFHDVKKEWISNVDFIYSNSFDHSYKPRECLDTWMSCIKKKGFCILEWTNGHVEYTKLDPFGGSFKDYKKLIKKKYNLKDILKSPNNRFYKLKKTYFFIVSHK